MQIKKNKNWLYLISAVWIVFILTLGAWWIYLFFSLAEIFQSIDVPGINTPSFLNMIKWEGLTFIILLLLLTTSFMAIFITEHRKTKALQAFFASLTHELKTPLASIRLQSEVLENRTSKNEDPKVRELLTRLIQDTSRLERELDNSLQLSRVLKGGNLNLQSVEIDQHIRSFFKKNCPVEFEFDSQVEDATVIVDTQALDLILRNLIDNTQKHNKSEKKKISMVTSIAGDDFVLEYHDNGQPFTGEMKQIKELFYRHDSYKGTGIGLYLVDQLLQQMDGQLQITNQGCLVFKILLRISP